MEHRAVALWFGRGESTRCRPMSHVTKPGGCRAGPVAVEVELEGQDRGNGEALGLVLW